MGGVRWDTLVEVDEGKHGGLRVGSASQGTLSQTVGVLGPLNPANLEDEASKSPFGAACQLGSLGYMPKHRRPISMSELVRLQFWTFSVS